MEMSVTFLGGFREQGRSSFTVDLGGRQYLFDAGIKKVFTGRYYGEPPHLELVDVEKLEAVFVSHLHEDHMAMVPWLVKKGFSGPIYMTGPTYELGRKQWVKWSEEFERDGRRLYGLEDAERASSQVRLLEPGERVEVGDISVVPRVSGHAIGSVYMEIEAGGYRILYLADIAAGSNVLADPEVEAAPYDMVIINASYGHGVLPRAALEEILARRVARTLERGGIAFIPLTAVGRGQETLAILAKHRYILPKDAEIYAEESIRCGFGVLGRYEGYLKRRFVEAVKSGLFDDVEYFSPEEYRSILSSRPCVVLAPDLMLMKLSRKIFFEIKDDEKSTVLITGYQAPGTFGRRLLEARGVGAFSYGGQVVTFKVRVDNVPVKMHFDFAENLALLERLYSVSEPLVALHHGEEPKTLRLANALAEYIPPGKLILPTVPSRLYLGVVA